MALLAENNRSHQADSGRLLEVHTISIRHLASRCHLEALQRALLLTMLSKFNIFLVVAPPPAALPVSPKLAKPCRNWI